jgi:tetratricopeptide (TPR) repeat protein
MKMLLSIAAAIIIAVGGMAYAEQFNVDLNLKKPEAIANQAEADQWFNKGNTAYQENNYDEAVTCYKKAVALDPAFASAFYNLGIIYDARGMADEAISAYKQVLAIKPDYHTASTNLASAYTRKGMIDDAIAELKKALDRNDQLPHAHFLLAECYVKKDRTPQAADHYYKAGMLFTAGKDKAWAERSYAGLKKTDNLKLQKELLQKMNAELQ